MSKRKVSRFTKNIPVKIIGNTERNSYVDGWIMDMSKDGLMIKAKKEIPESEEIEILVNNPGTSGTFEIPGRIIWKQPDSNNYGVNIKAFDGEKRRLLDEYIEDNILGLGSIKASLLRRIKIYKHRAKEIEDYLNEHPEEWGRFQNEFNEEINSIFREIMNYEKENMIKGNKNKVDKLKTLFVDKFRDVFSKGEYVSWSLRKPFGYAGDFKIIDDLYRNNPTTKGFERLFDNYTQMSSIAVAVRNRKEDFKRLIMEHIDNKKNGDVRLMDLACGPCRIIKELFENEKFQKELAIFDCYELEQKAIDYAKELLGSPENVNFFKENALKIALKKDIYAMFNNKYDIIYSLGLFDYFNEEVATRLVSNLKKLLKHDGKLLVATVRDKYSNPSVYFMEWAADWNLVYRSDEEFMRIFTNAGFAQNQLKIKYEQQGIINYIVASK